MTASFDAPGSVYHTYNTVESEVFLGSVVQGGHVVIETPREMTPALGGLPAAARVFTGRDADLVAVAGALGGEGARVVVVCGLGGVGKTELALHAAHLVSESEGRFSGGVLFVDLLGYDPERAVRPYDALATLLRSLGVAAEQIPGDLDGRAALFRTLLKAYADGGRPLLVVVDNAADAAEVKPLLPGDGGCAALVTSRHRLDGLEARHVALDVLPPEAGVRLLGLVLRQSGGGDDPRIAGEPDAASRIVELCGRLPLALRIVAARLADDPDLELAEFVDYLTDAGARLDELERADRTVRAAFTLSYGKLSGEQARLFRLLSLAPGADASEALAALLLDTDARTARRHLEALRRAHLVDSRGSRDERRWRMHDLVRLYAAELVCAQPEPAAVNRILDHYGLRLRVAVELLGSVAPEVVERGAALGIAGKGAAVRWLDREYPTLLHVPQLAADHGHFEQAVRISLAFDEYCLMRGYSDDWRWMIKRATDLVDRLPEPVRGELNALGSIQYAEFAAFWGGDGADAVAAGARAVAAARGGMGPAGEARARLAHGRALRAAGRRGDAERQLGLAARRAREAGDTRIEATALQITGYLLADDDTDQARVNRGLDFLRRAADLGADHGHSYVAVSALTGVSEILRARSHRTGRDASAELIEATTRARDVARRFGDRPSESLAVGYLGDALRDAGRPGEAADAYRGSVELARESGDLRGRGIALSKLGGVLERAGRAEEAFAAHREAADLLRDADYRWNEGVTLGYLARALLRAGDTAGAAAAYRRAAEAYRVAGHGRGVEEVGRKLAELESRITGPYPETQSHMG
ncbi:ATP-binding protein [Streptomyces sp. NPDC050085]|uniref:ATP-binding protein n=1 Tax=Streptomyces sp. NPDC050085 TaxID=3365600 RepID=UPI00379101DE